MAEQKELVEIISPEGVEERLIEEIIFRVTMTGGGKFRLYGGEQNALRTLEICETEELAKTNIGKYMTLLGSLRFDPNGTLDMITQALRNHSDKR